ncbi:MAG: hypothetical protein CV087_23095 [Candidatus Brocadia sp. WS118]|nr:MAG: hypothetical protein CV087_23095 [Candidatus Brocadia sp. WS118]
MKKRLSRFLILLCLPTLAFVPGEDTKDIRPGKDFALLFAVSNYQNPDLRDLEQPIKDAIEIAKILEEEYDFQTEVIRDPSYQEITEKLQDYRKAFSESIFPKDGQLLLFFSGHGMVEDGLGFFLPADAVPGKLITTALAYDTWRSFFNGIDCQHILVAIDACFSVRFDPNWDNRGDSKRFKRPGELSEDERILGNHSQYPSRLFITSDAEENAVPGESNFARKILQGLSESFSATFVTLDELYADFISKAQPVPHIGSFGDDDPRSNFLFFPRDAYFQNSASGELEFWQDIQRENTKGAYQTYLRRYPDGYFAPVAQEKLKEIEKLSAEIQAWENARAINDAGIFKEFLANYPESPHAEEASKRIYELTKIDEDSFPHRYEVTPNGDGVNDYLAFPTIENNPEYLEESILLITTPDNEEILTVFSYANNWDGGLYLKDLGTGGGPFTFLMPEDKTKTQHPAGTYKFELHLANGQKFSGTIELIR